MANLTGMPISSLPETTLQEGDQVVGYRAETGKAYRTDLADQIADLTEQVSELNQSLTDITSAPPFANCSGAFTGDCNDLTDPGFVSNVIDQSCTNGPDGFWYMLVLKYTRSDPTVTQVCFGYNTVRLAIRYRYNSDWSDWKIFS